MVNSSTIQIQVNPNTYLKNPISSELGRKIVQQGIEVMHDLGYEQFTFRKLAQKIESTEASVYRYFEGKHKLLLYFISWYWTWTEYRLIIALTNIDSPKERLNRALTILTTETNEDGNFQYVNETKLQRIVISESSKAYLNRAVDDVNKDGVFSDYKRVVANIAQIVLEIDGTYKYPHMLVSTVVEGAHHERFFSEHLPRLTDSIEGEDSIQCFFQDLVYKALNIK